MTACDFSSGSWSKPRGPFCKKCGTSMKDWLRCDPSKRAERLPDACAFVSSS